MEWTDVLFLSVATNLKVNLPEPGRQASAEIQYVTRIVRRFTPYFDIHNKIATT